MRDAVTPACELRPFATAMAPPDFGAALAALGDGPAAASIAEIVRVDIQACGQLFLLVPTIERYAAFIDPTAHPAAADEVAFRMAAIVGAEFPEVARRTARRFPAWRSVLRRAMVALELFGDDRVPGGLPGELGPALADGRARFVLGNPLGAGSFGVIVGATDRAGERGREGDVAVKLLRPNGDDPTPWSTEAARAAAIEHRCGVAVLGHGALVDGSGGWVAFERVHGRSLAALAAAGERIPPAVAAAEALELALALDELHRSGHAHGDVSLSNILLDELGRLRLVDYGLSRTIDAAAAAQDVRRLAEVVQWMALGWLPRRGHLPWRMGLRGALLRTAARHAVADRAEAGALADDLAALLRRARTVQVLMGAATCAAILAAVAAITALCVT